MPKRKDASQPYFPPGESQGHLARPAFFMQGSERYPRGFTPERQREVNEALSGVMVGAFNEPHDSRGPLRAGSREDALVRETIARSTVPARDLRGLHTVMTGAEHLVDSAAEHAAGFYESKRGTFFGEFPVADVVLRDRMSASDHDLWREPASVNRTGSYLIHELGHHRQNRHFLSRGSTRNPYRSEPDYMYAGGGHAKFEADAENYKDQHFVPDRRFPDDPESRMTGYDEILRDHAPQVLLGQGPHTYLSRWAGAYAKHRNISPRQFLPEDPGTEVGSPDGVSAPGYSAATVARKARARGITPQEYARSVRTDRSKQLGLF